MKEMGCMWRERGGEGTPQGGGGDGFHFIRYVCL